jgi:hypothetical protein
LTTTETREETTTTVREMPCCERRVRLRIPIANGPTLHERTCPECALEWTFATQLRITPPESLTGDSIFEYGYTVSLLEGRLTGSVATRDVLGSADGWIDASHEELRKKHLEIQERRRGT